MAERKTNDELIQEIKGYWNNIQNLTNDMYVRPNKLSTEELMAEFEYPQSKPEENNSVRLNGTPKGLGYFGAIPTKDGGTMTEISGGTPGDTREIFAPTINPLLSREEIDYLAAGGKVTNEIYRKAQTHAKDRIEQGLSPFAGSDEIRELPQRKENSMKLDGFLKKLSKATIPTGALEVELPDAKGEKKEVDINATKVVKDAGQNIDMLKSFWKSMSKKDVALLGGASVVGGVLGALSKSEPASKWDKLEDYGCHEVLDSVGEIKSIAAKKGMNLNKLYNRVVAPYESKIEKDDNGSFARKVLKPKLDKEIKRMLNMKTSSLDSLLKRAAEFLPEGVDAKQLEMGREVEKEHKKTYEQIKEKGLPTLEQFSEWIANDHLNEPGNEEYYTKLQTIEKHAGVADFLKRLGTKSKPEPKPEGLLKLIDEIKPKEDPMKQLLQHEISKGGSIR